MKTDNPIKLVEGLLKKHETALLEAARHAAMVEDLRAEEARLLKTTRMEDTTAMEALKTIRFKIEIAPSRAEEFKASADDLLVEIGEAVLGAAKYLKEVIEQGRRQIVEVICSELTCFFAGRERDALETSLLVLEASNYGQRSSGWFTYLSGDNFDTLPPLLKAQRLLALSGDILNTSVLTDEFETGAHPRTVDELERRELLEIVRFPEERIHRKMAGGLSRKEALRAVQGRREFLEQKFGKVAPPAASATKPGEA